MKVQDKTSLWARISGIVFLAFVLQAGITMGIAAAEPEADYSQKENWAYFNEGGGKGADIFLICPTVDMNDEYNMSLDDEETKESFFGALNMERGIYEESLRMFAPYYRQAAMKVYGLDAEEREQYLEMA